MRTLEPATCIRCWDPCQGQASSSNCRQLEQEREAGVADRMLIERDSHKEDMSGAPGHNGVRLFRDEIAHEKKKISSKPVKFELVLASVMGTSCLVRARKLKLHRKLLGY